LPDKLQKTVDDPLPKQRNESPLPIQINNNNKWEIKKILVCKLVRGILKYHIS